MNSKPWFTRRAAAAPLFLGLLSAAAPVSAAAPAGGQSRPPIQRVDFSVAHRVRDIEPGSDQRDFGMGQSARLDNYLIGWMLTDTNFCYPYLWSIDLASGRSTLLEEISPLYPLSEPFVVYAGRLYFGAKVRSDWATHLWSTDGTRDGTRQEIGPDGLGFDFPAGLISYGGFLYFFAATSADSYSPRLWRTDGTADGTRPVSDVRGLPPQCIGFEGGGGCGTTQPPTTMLGARMLFVGLSPGYPNTSYALYGGDGKAGTFEVLFEFPYGYPSSLATFGDTAFFAVEGVYPIHGSQLWRTNGTRAGTRMVSEFCAGWCNSGVLYPKSEAGTLYFFVYRDGRSSFWKSDGTEAGTVPLAEVTPGTGQYTVAAGLLFFVSWQESRGYEVWRTDGTAGGTRLVRDIRTGSTPSYVGGLVAAGPYLFFTADDGSHGMALWRTDGTENGTVLLKPLPQVAIGALARAPVAFGNAVYFAGEDPDHGTELWRSDGTLEGTRMVADIYPGPDSSDVSFLPVQESRLQFLARDSEGVSVWETDGFADGTRRLAGLDSGADPRSSDPSFLNDVEGQLFFFTRKSCTCALSDLWVSDGTESGTLHVNQLHSALSAVSAGGNLYFADSGSEGAPPPSALYRIDRALTMTKLADVRAENLTAFGDAVFFDADGALWRAAGNRDGIRKIGDAYAYALTPSGAALYFGTGGDDPALWKTDGSVSGTTRIQSGAVAHLTDAGGLLYYVRLYEPDGVSLRITSASWAGSSLVRFFSTGSIADDPFSSSVGTADLLFFLLRDGYSYKLWRSNGTDPGTYRVSDVAASGPLVSDGTGVYFVGFDPEHGYELWHSFGTAESTNRVKDIQPGPGSSSPSEMKFVDGVLLFSADDGVHGRELWRSDGTEGGTYLVDDICPGACSSSPAGFTASAEKVFFSANDGETGTELWTMPISALHRRTREGVHRPRLIPPR